MRMRPFFSFFGAKWRLAPHYPMPQYPTIIEPFAGSACYSLYHYRKQVQLYDVDPVIADLWRWLIKVPCKHIERLPIDIESLDDMPRVSPEIRSLIGFWFVKGAARPAQKRYAWARSGDFDEQFWGEIVRDRVAQQVNKIRHWQAFHKSYEDIPNNMEATWFIDPPYQKAGRGYAFNLIDYKHLAQWCLSRKGQVIVCEQNGAAWLKFKSFITTKALKNGTSSEVIFLSGPQGLLF